MENLWIDLPPVAPDYSGVCSAMFDLGGLSVIHDAGGCTGNYTGYDEPRWYGSTAKVFCSGLREIDAVLGNDENFIDKILQAGEKFNSTMYTVIGSPVPMVIGTDMTGVAHELEERSNKPALGFDMNGLSLYNKGASEAICKLIKKFTKDSVQKIPRGINILGSLALDLAANGNAEDLADTLEKWGFHLIGRMMMGASIEQIEELSKAEINLVVTQSGLAAARLLEQKYQIPYVVGMPLAGQDDIHNALEATLKDGKNRIICDESEEGEILIVGEQVLSNSIRRVIIRKNPTAKVTVGTLYGLDPLIGAKNDLDIPGEKSLRTILNSGKYHVLIGDPLMQDLIHNDTDLRLVELPHVALSSKIYWNRAPHLLRQDMEDLLEKVLTK